MKANLKIKKLFLWWKQTFTFYSCG